MIVMEESNVSNYDPKCDEPVETVHKCVQMRNLSVKSKLIMLYVLILIHLTLILGDVLLYSLCVIAHFCIIFPFFKLWEKHRESCPLDAVIRSFGQGYILMAWCVIPLCAVVTFGIAHFAHLDILMLAILIFVTMVGVEELFKVLFARKMKKQMDINRETVANQLTYTATSVGYAVSNTALVAVCLGLVKEASYSGPTWTWQLIILHICIVFAVVLTVPMQVLSGYLIGLNTTRQLPFWRVGLESFFLRALFTVARCVILVTFPPPRSFLAAFASDFFILFVFIVRIKKVEGKLPVDYLHRVGYLKAFGYGVLPGGDVNEFEIPPHSRVQMV